MHSLHNISLKPYNTFGIDAQADRLVRFANAQEVQSYFEALQQPEHPHLVIGGGSNLLFSKDYKGVLYKIENKGIELYKEDAEHVYIKVAAGEVWDDVVAHCVAQQWGGIENLSLIPGTAGAAAVQNIGAYGVEIAQRLVWVEAVDMNTGQMHVFDREDLSYGYRYSAFKDEKREYLITHIGLRLDKIPQYVLTYKGVLAYLEAQKYAHTLHNIRKAIVAIRESKLPKPEALGNAGSFFKNPVISAQKLSHLQAEHADIPFYRLQDSTNVKVPAAWLIEQSGAHLIAFGDAQVYDKHALILVNKGNATGADLYRLAQAIQHKVHQRFGIRIEPEVLIY